MSLFLQYYSHVSLFTCAFIVVHLLKRQRYRFDIMDPLQGHESLFSSNCQGAKISFNKFQSERNVDKIFPTPFNDYY